MNIWETIGLIYLLFQVLGSILQHLVTEESKPLAVMSQLAVWRVYHTKGIIQLMLSSVWNCPPCKLSLRIFIRLYFRKHIKVFTENFSKIKFFTWFETSQKIIANSTSSKCHRICLFFCFLVEENKPSEDFRIPQKMFLAQKYRKVILGQIY